MIKYLVLVLASTKCNPVVAYQELKNPTQLDSVSVLKIKIISGMVYMGPGKVHMGSRMVYTWS